MSLTKDEKKTVVGILSKHIEEIEKNEKNPLQQAGQFGTELNYAEYLRKIVKKLS